MASSDTPGVITAVISTGGGIVIALVGFLTARSGRRGEGSDTLSTLRSRLKSKEAELASIEVSKRDVDALLKRTEELLRLWVMTAYDMEHAGNNLISAARSGSIQRLGSLPQTEDIKAWRADGGVKGHLE